MYIYMCVCVFMYIHIYIYIYIYVFFMSKNRKLNIPVLNEHFGSKIQSQSLTLYHLNMFVTFVVESICSKLDLLLIWYLMTAHHWRLILRKSFSSNLHVTCVNSVTKALGLQPVGEFMWGCMRTMSMKRQLFNLSLMQ